MSNLSGVGPGRFSEVEGSLITYSQAHLARHNVTSCRIQQGMSYSLLRFVPPANFLYLVAIRLVRSSRYSSPHQLYRNIQTQFSHQPRTVETNDMPELLKNDTS